MFNVINVQIHEPEGKTFNLNTKYIKKINLNSRLKKNHWNIYSLKIEVLYQINSQEASHQLTHKVMN